MAEKELAKPGVYFLTGTDASTGKPAIYIGETENVIKRVKRHAQEDQKDYWVNTVAFVSKDDNLTKAHIRYLEGRLIQTAHDCKRAVVMNSTSSGSPLPRAARAEMDVFFHRMLQLLPVLGVHQLSAPVTTKGVADDSAENTGPVFYCKTRKLVASGQRSEEGFIVFSGSQAVLTPNKAFPKGSAKYRDRLIEKEILQKADDHYVFAEDHEFSSPSAAAGLVKGGSVNGLTAWVTEDNTSLKNIES